MPASDRELPRTRQAERDLEADVSTPQVEVRVIAASHPVVRQRQALEACLRAHHPADLSSHCRYDLGVGRRPVWISKGHFEDDESTCTWGTEGRTGKPFAVPSPESLLIVFDQDKLPVELWRVATVTHFEPYVEHGWTWFAETTMAELVTTSINPGVTGIAFHDVALYVLPPNGGWLGAPMQLNDAQISELFDMLGWPAELRRQ